jgi:hypothetical protein
MQLSFDQLFTKFHDELTCRIKPLKPLEYKHLDYVIRETDPLYSYYTAFAPHNVYGDRNLCLGDIWPYLQDHRETLLIVYNSSCITTIINTNNLHDTSFSKNNGLKFVFRSRNILKLTDFEHSSFYTEVKRIEPYFRRV